MNVNRFNRRITSHVVNEVWCSVNKHAQIGAWSSIRVQLWMIVSDRVFHNVGNLLVKRTA